MRKVFTATLILGCLGGAFLFYKMNQGDWINASIFGVGLLGILMSYLRNSQ